MALEMALHIYIYTVYSIYFPIVIIHVSICLLIHYMGDECSKLGVSNIHFQIL